MSPVNNNNVAMPACCNQNFIGVATGFSLLYILLSFQVILSSSLNPPQVAIYNFNLISTKLAHALY